VNAENAVADQSMQHPDGWGIGWFVEQDAYVIKSANAAHASARFKAASERLTSHTFVVHVRRATVGEIDHLNAHPFRFGRWLFAHNGTIFGMSELAEWMSERTDPTLEMIILGDTDSERLFYYLLSGLVRAGVDRTGRIVDNPEIVGATIRALLLDLDAESRRRGLDRPITNIILTNGDLFVAHRAGMPLFMSTQKHFCGDLPTCPAPKKVCMEPKRPVGQPVNLLIVASEPIAADENIWEDVEDGTTVILCGDFNLSIVGPPDGWVAPVLPEWAKEAPVSC
jgi:glutamine amidotransferase